MSNGTPFKNDAGSNPSIVTVPVNAVAYGTVTTIVLVLEVMASDTTLVFNATEGLAGHPPEGAVPLPTIPGVLICHKYPLTVS
jgi:hypothetical protein